MKILKKSLPVFLLFLFIVSTALASDLDDFHLLEKYFRDKNYPMVKNLARSLVQSKEYRYHTKLILAEAYFQEGDLYASAELLKELIGEYPKNETGLKKRIERVEREIAFTAKGSSKGGKWFRILWGNDSMEDNTLISGISEIFDDAYKDGGRFFGWYPEEIIQVLVYQKDEYSLYTAMPKWSQGGYDGKIRLKLYRGIKKEHLKEIIYHEYAHLLIYGITKGNCPLWFNEASAQYFSMKHAYGGIPHRVVSMPVYTPENFPENWSGFSDAEIKKLYAESLNLLSYIISKTSEYVIGNVLKDLGGGVTFSSAINGELRVYGLNSKTLMETE